MYGKLEINGTLESMTGLHIGGGSEFAAIGAVDSVVIRDVKDDMSMIPGSSFKGKLRTLIAKQLSEALPKEHDNDDDRIRRLFGYSGLKDEDKKDKSKKKKSKAGRLYFSDMFLSEESKDELKKFELDATEIKFENTINRLTGIANPRQIERAIKGLKYDISLIYNIEEESEIKEDFETLKTAFKLLKYDYLGANGTRGYGRVDIKELEIKPVVVEKNDKLNDIIASCEKILKEV